MSNFLWTNAPTQKKKNIISLFNRKFSIRMCTQKWKSKYAVGQCYEDSSFSSDQQFSIEANHGSQFTVTINKKGMYH